MSEILERLLAVVEIRLSDGRIIHAEGELVDCTLIGGAGHHPVEAHAPESLRLEVKQRIPGEQWLTVSEG